MRAPPQQALLVSMLTVLRPIAKLLLSAGIGYSEFAAMAKIAFVRVASDDFGLRGRPTNTSRISAMTGMSRKEISAIRQDCEESRWTPDMETNPANRVINYWHHDPTFSSAPGKPRPLAFSGPDSFSTLVAEYAGDIPPGAIRKELLRSGTIRESPDGLLIPERRHFFSLEFDEDFVKRIAFSLQNLGSTVAYNAAGVSQAGVPRFERYAWTEHLVPGAVESFQAWVSKEGARFIERADDWIAKNELPKRRWNEASQLVVGVGMYYFQEAPKADR